MYAIFILTLFTIAIISSIKRIEEDSEAAKFTKEYVSNVENSISDAIISKHETRELEITLLENELYAYTLTTRFKQKNNDGSTNYTLRAIYENVSFGLSLTVASIKTEIKDLEGQKHLVFPVAIYSNNVESDNFLTFLTKQWNIEKIGFDIDWEKGTAMIYETSILQRELIINKMMV
jgi:hypothetical protein